MAAARQDHDPRAGDRRMPSLAIGRRKEPVVLAPEDEGGNADSVQPALELRIMVARLPGELRHHPLVRKPDILVLGHERAGDSLVGEFRFEIGLAHRLLLAEQEGIEMLDAGDVNAWRIDERQRREPAGVAHGEVRRDPSAERQADKMNLAQIERVEEIKIEIGEVRHRLEPGRRVAAAEPRSLRHDHLEFLGERLHRRKKARRAARTVQHQHRRARAGALHRNGRAAHRDRR